MLDAKEFEKVHRRTAAGARENFLRDGYLAGVTLFYDAAGEQHVALLADPQTPQAEVEHRFKTTGVMLIPGSWRGNLAQLQWFAEITKAVAATTIGESWLAQQEMAVEVLRMEIPVSEHPMKDEVITTVSVWPAQGYHNMAVDKIVRTKTGSTVRLERLKHDFDKALFAGWLPDLLPS